MRTPEIEGAARRQWLIGLLESGVTPQQVGMGIKACRASDSPFFPSVGQFVHWAKEAAEETEKFPSDLNCRLAIASELARPADVRDWSRYHPVVYWIYSKHSTHDWKVAENKIFEPMVTALWREARKLFHAGHQFTLALPGRKSDDDRDNRPPASKEFAASFCSEILNSLGNTEDSSKVKDE